MVPNSVSTSSYPFGQADAAGIAVVDEDGRLVGVGMVRRRQTADVAAVTEKQRGTAKSWHARRRGCPWEVAVVAGVAAVGHRIAGLNAVSAFAPARSPVRTLPYLAFGPTARCGTAPSSPASSPAGQRALSEASPEEPSRRS